MLWVPRCAEKRAVTPIPPSSPTPEQRLIALSAKQEGVFAINQLARVSVHPRIVHNRAGRIVEVLPRVYRFASTPETARLRLRAALLHRRHGVFCLETAAWLLGLDRSYEPKTFDFAVPAGHSRSPVAWLRHHQLRLTKDDRYVTDGLPLTSATRTLIDLAAGGDRERIKEMMDDALRKGLTSIPRICVRLKRTRNFRGMKLILSLLNDRRLWRGKDVGSPMEQVFWDFLEDNDYPVPRLQDPLCDAAGNWVGNVDFAFREQRLIVECDGEFWHSTRRDRANDEMRDLVAKEIGWKTLRLDWDDLDDFAKLRRLLAAHGVHPTAPKC